MQAERDSSRAVDADTATGSNKLSIYCKEFGVDHACRKDHMVQCQLCGRLACPIACIKPKSKVCQYCLDKELRKVQAMLGESFEAPEVPSSSAETPLEPSTDGVLPVNSDIANVTESSVRTSADVNFAVSDASCH